MLEVLESKNIDRIPIDLFEDFAHKSNQYNIGFYLFEKDGDVIIDSAAEGSNLDRSIASELVIHHIASGQDGWVRVNECDDIYAYTYKDGHAVLAVAILYGSKSESVDILCELLAVNIANFQIKKTSAMQLDKLTSELSHTYEELSLLYKMSMTMKFTQSSASYLQSACDNITELVDVEGIAILLERSYEGQRRMMVTAGSGIIKLDAQMIDILEMSLQKEVATGRDLLLDSHVDGSIKYDWPAGIRSIIAIPLYRKDRMVGIMVAVNRREKEDFDSIDAKLFSTVANECAVFIDNDKLFVDLKELFVGALKALTKSIDAKDQYTRGHSERVAYISRWIAEKLVEAGKSNMSEDDVHRIYLAGLLHDIGKIGIDEKVLRKNSKLDSSEWKQIQSHPTIGASILGDIKQMGEIIPGVIGHHERVDGKGYPHSLVGNEIPMIAKIIAVADAFDAMISKRVYRDALSIRRAVSEINKGLGTQFDETVGTVFLESDLKQLWDSIQDGFIESWDYSNFSEYGAQAVGTLLQ